LEGGEIQQAVPRHAEAEDGRSDSGRSVLFARLLVGLVVLICAEVFSGASLKLGLWHPWTLLMTYWLYGRRQPLDGNAVQVEKRELRLVVALFAGLMVLSLALSPLSQNPILLGIIIPNFVIWTILGVLLLVASLVSCVRGRTA
jgi:hypothetical protein